MDIRAGGAVVASNVQPGDQVALVVPAGTVSADVVLAGTDTVVLGPADLNLAAGTATFVHAVESAEGDSLGLVSFTVSGLGSAPAVRRPVADRQARRFRAGWCSSQCCSELPASPSDPASCWAHGSPEIALPGQRVTPRREQPSVARGPFSWRRGLLLLVGGPVAW